MYFLEMLNGNQLVVWMALWPLHPTTLVKWRNRVGDKLESLLEEILNVAIETKALKRHALKPVNVDTTVHEPDVHCIAKGKIHKRYEFGSKVSIVTTSKDNWVVSAQSLDNPYDGHTLESALNHVTQLTGIKPEHVYCDMGYQGHGIKEKTKVHLVGKIPKLLAWFYWPEYFSALFSDFKFVMRSSTEKTGCLMG